MLLLLLGAEVAMSRLNLPREARPVVLIPALAMIGVVLAGFMRLGRGSVLVRGFAVAALVWLIVLLGLGSLGTMTRNVFPVGERTTSLPHSTP
jgi:hypothetical protein